MPFGAGRGSGRGGGRGRHGRRGLGGGRGRIGLSAENCICPRCGAVLPHRLGVPCFQTACPNCASPMTRQFNVSGTETAGRAAAASPKPVVDQDACTGCGECVSVCPEEAIEDFYLNEFLDRKQHIGLNVVKVIIQYDLDMLFTNRIGEIAFSMLKENLIDIYQIQDEKLTVKAVIELYRQNRLTRILNATHSVDEAEVESRETR